jgi:hypothetical protein
MNDARSVRSGGDIVGSTIIPGDHNVVVINARQQQFDPSAHPLPD